MRIRREEQSDEVFLNLTAFIDMMLVLVIFFLATSRFHEEERDERIRLARSKSTMPIAATSSDLLVINVDKDGRKIVDEKVRTLEELDEIVRARKAVKPDSDVVIRADERAFIGQLGEAHDICVRHGFKNVSFAYTSAGAPAKR